MDLWPYRVAEAFLERYVSTDLLLLVCFKRVCVSRIDCVTPFSTAELCVVADVLDCIHKHENCVTIRACLWLNPESITKNISQFL